jgi:hypothetical protein
MAVVLPWLVQGCGGAAGDPTASTTGTSDSVELDSCPPDTTKPIPVTLCPAGNEPMAGKLSPADLATLSASPHAVPVLVTVAGGADVCALPSCATSTRECPTHDDAIVYWQRKNLASQRCVRERVAAIGGSTGGDPYWIVNSFEAVLTWPQIQLLATHPHVLSIEAGGTGAPPP